MVRLLVEHPLQRHCYGTVFKFVWDTIQGCCVDGKLNNHRQRKARSREGLRATINHGLGKRGSGTIDSDVGHLATPVTIQGL